MKHNRMLIAVLFLFGLWSAAAVADSIWTGTSGGEYVLLKGPSATSDKNFSFNYDEKYVRLIKDTSANEVRVKAKNLNGTIFIIR